jgi:hypothetical protein
MNEVLSMVLDLRTDGGSQWVRAVRRDLVALAAKVQPDS